MIRKGPAFWDETSADHDRAEYEDKLKRFRDLASRSAQVLSDEVTEEDGWDDVRASITAIVAGTGYSIGRAYSADPKTEAHADWGAYLQTFVDGVNRGWADAQSEVEAWKAPKH